MRLFSYVPVLTCLLASASEVASVKPFPTATRPPIPPPPPPRIIFLHRDEQTDRIQSHEMIAPNYVQQGHIPNLSVGNPDFQVQGASGYRPQRPQQPQRPPQTLRPQPQRPPRPQPQRPQQHTRPQPQPQQPQRPHFPQPMRPQYQQPQPQRPQVPQNPFSRPVARPPIHFPHLYSYQGDPFYYRYYTNQIIP